MADLPQNPPPSPQADGPADLPRHADVAAAAVTLAGRVVHTPLLEAPGLAAPLGYRLFVKAESLQRTGSFKFRGALYRLLLLDAAARRRGVVAFSSGNHAQGVACAASLLGIPATIIMPADAPRIKIDNTRGYGAEIVLYDRARDDREAIGARLATERGATLVKPYDDAIVLAGQGTAALEAIADAAALGVEFAALAAPASGGGLIAGSALAAEGLSPATRCYAAEPVGLDDHARSLAQGMRVANPPAARSICDALQAAMPGEVTFPINRRLLAGAVTVSDDEVRHAMRAAFTALKLVLEPSGAAALAAALAGRIPVGAGAGGAVCVIASGGNVDPAFFAAMLESDRL